MCRQSSQVLRLRSLPASGLVVVEQERLSGVFNDFDVVVGDIRMLFSPVDSVVE